MLAMHTVDGGLASVRPSLARIVYSLAPDRWLHHKCSVCVYICGADRDERCALESLFAARLAWGSARFVVSAPNHRRCGWRPVWLQVWGHVCQSSLLALFERSR